MDAVAVASGAVGGAILRWKLSSFAAKYSVVPWNTAAINVMGSFLLGAVYAQHPSIPSKTSLLVGTGFCGAFTTFSTFSVDVVHMIEKNQYSKAFVYVASTNILSIGAALFAYKLFRKSAISKK